jgi:nitric oxide reductase subunit B
MIVLAIVTYAKPHLTGRRDDEAETSLGLWAFWLQIGGMFGMTLAFATAGITQTYLERILGLGYLETQYKIQPHFMMLVGTGTIFMAGTAAFMVDFFRDPPRPPTSVPEVESAETARL